MRPELRDYRAALTRTLDKRGVSNNSSQVHTDNNENKSFSNLRKFEDHNNVCVTLDDINKAQYIRNMDEFSNCNATIASTEYTYAFGRRYQCRYRNSKIRRVIMQTQVSICGIDHMALVGTGATISAIHPRKLKEIEQSIYRFCKIEPFKISLSVEESNQYVVDEQIEVVIVIEGYELLWRFFVVPNLSSDLVIGMDWLSAYKVDIRCDLMKLIIGLDMNEEQKLIPDQNDGVSKIDGSCATNRFVDSRVNTENFSWSENLSIPLEASTESEDLSSEIENCSEHSNDEGNAEMNEYLVRA